MYSNYRNGYILETYIAPRPNKLAPDEIIPYDDITPISTSK